VALKGNVETLSLVEIFEIICAAEHTGILKVGNGQTVRVLKFYKGQLYYPKRDRQGTYRLGRLLVRAAGLRPEQLDEALKLQKERPGVLLGELLLEKGYVKEDDLTRVLAVKYKEEVYDLFLWRRAQFEFQKDVLPEGFLDEIHSGHALPLTVAGIVMEATNRIDEWKRIHRAIPSLRLVCREARGKAAEIDKVLRESKIDPNAHRFDGRTNLQMIFDAWEHTFFESHRIAFQLLKDGLIVPLTGEELKARVIGALAAREFALALRLYEGSIECIDNIDASVAVGELLFGTQGLPRDQSADLGFNVATSGKKALHIVLGLFDQNAIGRVVVTENKNRRVITFAKDALGVETYGTNTTPDVVHYAARRGLLDPVQIAEVARKRREQGRSIQSVLLDDKYITPKDWTLILTDKLVDEIYDIFFWGAPQVEFKTKLDPAPAAPGPANLRLQMPYAIPSFQDELKKNLDRVRRYLESVPSVRTVFVDSRGGPPYGHRDVLMLFDGRRSVIDVLGLVHWARRDLLKFIHNALEMGEIRRLTKEQYVEAIDLALHESRWRDAQTLCFSAIDEELDSELFNHKLDEAKYAEEESLPSMLEGDFESVSLAEILQSLQRKRLSGTLEISDEKRSKTIHFNDGDVYILRVEEQKSDFAQMFLDEATVDLVSETFGGDLVEKGLLNEDELGEAQALEIKEELWEMFLWDGANFVFSRNVLPPEFHNPPQGTTRLGLKTEGFLLEAIRRINDWEDLRKRFPEPKIVLQFTSAEAKMRALGTKGAAELLYLIDGRRSLQDVIRISGHPRQEVYRLVAELEDEGALRRRSPEDVSAASASAPPPASRGHQA
jgi:hypothetical protein